MKKYCVALVLAALMVSGRATADPLREVQYAAVPDWILPPSIVSASAPSGEAAFRVVYQDTEDRLTAGKIETYTAYRIRILKPEALAFGNITLSWSPSAGPATVHFVRIIRGGTTIDVLKDTKFRVLEREAGLEQSILDGNLTAQLQVPGLQVGDEIEFAGTIARSEPAFGGHAAGVRQLPVDGYPGMFRYRLLWPSGRALAWRQSKDLSVDAPTSIGGFKALQIELRDPPAAIPIEGAPGRYQIRRIIQFSDFRGWADLSRQMWPLFEKASQLQPKSPIRAEAATIAAASSNPLERAQAALRLVQEQIRYVFVGLNGGDYVPATADDTWQRRFGDCKAKTAVLLALLKELGIAAEPVLVNSKGGDGINQQMANPELFDHVLVRANVAGKIYWLDGTRFGDRYLDMLPAPTFEWGLPLTASGADLVSIPAATSVYPETTSVVDIDATGGFGKDAIWTVKDVMHGDAALKIETALSAISPTDAQRQLEAYFRKVLSSVQPEQVSWHFDERHSSVLLSMKGTGKVDWEGDSKSGHSLTILGAGFYAPDKHVRPKDQDATLPWSVEHPRFRCWATTVHLPKPTTGFHWGYSSKPVNRRLAGTVFWRAAGMQGDIVRTVMSRQSFTRELSSAEAARDDAQIPTFDNNMSTVEETTESSSSKRAGLPFTEEPDWLADPAICSPPSK